MLLNILQCTGLLLQRIIQPQDVGSPKAVKPCITTNSFTPRTQNFSQCNESAHWGKEHRQSHCPVLSVPSPLLPLLSPSLLFTPTSHYLPEDLESSFLFFREVSLLSEIWTSSNILKIWIPSYAPSCYQNIFLNVTSHKGKFACQEVT